MIRSCLNCLIISQNLRRVVVSIPEVGSSNITILASPIKAIPTDSLRFWPPERVDASWNYTSSNSTALTILSTLLKTSNWVFLHLRAQKSSRCSRTVRKSKRTLCCGQTPRFSLSYYMLSKISKPSTVAWPSVGSISPVNILIVVVFPAPLCPNSAKIYPLYMVILSLNTAVNPF